MLTSSALGISFVQESPSQTHTNSRSPCPLFLFLFSSAGGNEVKRTGAKKEEGKGEGSRLSFPPLSQGKQSDFGQRTDGVTPASFPRLLTLIPLSLSFPVWRNSPLVRPKIRGRRPRLSPSLSRMAVHSSSSFGFFLFLLLLFSGDVVLSGGWTGPLVLFPPFFLREGEKEAEKGNVGME